MGFPLASLYSTTQTRRPEEDDWKEEVYQKIKSMKELYLPELSEMHQKIEAKLQQHEPLPHQAKSEQLEKLKIFKTMLERLMALNLVGASLTSKAALTKGLFYLVEKPKLELLVFGYKGRFILEFL
ncbi:hypothetical protein QN277_024359 [Acacia crassicarpa]|uniref:Uncharacterized protein n=1 Tax=Acacia crassicarpa TaxID=499986 RepID=A0AAE1K7J0_9FABA|nr:hypothetical protein QN277_024359 [Acacia crassicarpa]